MPAPSAGPRPFFLDGPAGPLFALYFPPGDATSASGTRSSLAQRGAVLHVPAFGEEMNRCRRMVALQARALAEGGFGVLVLDLYGTGDSAGDFGEATWEGWLADLAAGLAWLRGRGAERLTLWGARLGCALAAELAGQQLEALERLVFWQPVVHGKAFLTQLLRLRVAAAAMGPGPRETVEGLRSRLAAGEPLEVAGYEISPVLAAALDRAGLSALALPGGLAVDWLELGSDETGLAPASAAVVEAWSRAGVSVAARRVPGPPFWTTQEVATAPALLEVTTRALGGRTSGPASRD